MRGGFGRRRALWTRGASWGIALLAVGCAMLPVSRPAPSPEPAAPAPAEGAREARADAEHARRLDAALSRMEDLENAMARLGARLEGVEGRLEALIAQLAHAQGSRAPSAAGGLAPAPPREEAPAPAPAPGAAALPEAEDLYRAAMARLAAGERQGAALLLYDFVTRHPTHPLREGAQFQLAEIFYADRDFRGALREFEALLAAFPAATRAAEALLRIGLCQRALGDDAAARRTWERLAREHPGSASARQARTLLR
jgi:TolA-binding protein